MQLPTRHALFFFAFLFTLLTFVAAAPKPSPTNPPPPTPTNKCNTGPIQCCQKVTTAKDPVAGLIISLLGIVIRDLSTVVGLTCSPAIVGIHGAVCAAQPVCCTNNSFNGLIAIGCSPVSL